MRRRRRSATECVVASERESHRSNIRHSVSIEKFCDQQGRVVRVDNHSNDFNGSRRIHMHGHECVWTRSFGCVSAGAGAAKFSDKFARYRTGESNGYTFMVIGHASAVFE